MKTFKELITPKVLINSAISGGLVLFGACSNGNITLGGFGAAFAAGCVAFLTQLRADLFPKSKLGELKLFSIY